MITVTSQVWDHTPRDEKAYFEGQRYMKSNGKIIAIKLVRNLNNKLLVAGYLQKELSN